MQLTLRKNQPAVGRPPQASTGESPVARSARGVTLVEVMIAMTVALLLIAAMAQAFKMLGDSVNSGRSGIELQGELRTAIQLLQDDLKAMSVPARTWPAIDGAHGYTEIFDGPSRDKDSNGNLILDAGESAANDFNGNGTQDPPEPNYNTSQGDIDDILMFTARSTGEPFRGQILGQLVPQPDGTLLVVNPGHFLYDTSQPAVTEIESMEAEIAWWTVIDDVNSNGQLDHDLGESINLYRRVFLIRPDISMAEPYPSGGPPRVLTALYLTDRQAFYSQNDLSVYLSYNSGTPGSSIIVTNSMATLGLRENRFGHLRDQLAPPIAGTTIGPNTFYPATFPHEIARPLLTPRSGASVGEDVVLSHVLAFDLRVFDPTAPLQVINGPNTPSEIIEPGDPGYSIANALSGTNQAGEGAYVDLYYAPVTPATTVLQANSLSHFSGPPHARSQLFTAGGRLLPTYDTWSLFYEHDSYNQDGDTSGGFPLVDEGANGIDENGANGPDDAFERETSPPYNYPLRGLQATIRVIEPNSRQVRQTSVAIDFVPE